MTDDATPDDVAGPTGGFDLGALLGAAQSMQAQLAESQAQVAATVVTGTAGGGAVTVEVGGGFDFRSVTISPDVVDPEDATMLEDLVLAALRDAAARVGELQAQANPLPGLGGDLDLGGLGGLLGGA